MALNLYKHNQYGTLSDYQVDSNWTDIESEVNGLSGRLPLNNYAATTNPTVNNDVTQGYSNGSLWYNRTTDTAFVLTNASSGSASWVERDSISASDLGSAAFADILGTVSQSGGVPTGALMEYGSNANGEYWKYAGGMMACTFKHQYTGGVTDTAGNFYVSPNQTWTFPVEFSVRPHTSLMTTRPSGAAPDSFALAFIQSELSRIIFNVARSASDSTVRDYVTECIAIGRWF